MLINEILSNDSKFTFLIGAGCSRDSPSNLPIGKEMIEAIIEYTCPKVLIDPLKSLNTLRFEQLVQNIQETIDSDLKFIDYYYQCKSPNYQHQFLAQCLQEGHFVMTTNFDNLIEKALSMLVPKMDIICVITGEDFQKNSNPEKILLMELKQFTKFMILNQT